LAKKSRSEPGDALEQLQTFSDHASHWIATNPAIIVGVIGAVLLLAASYGGWRAWSGSRDDAASAALAEARTAYLEAMGRSPGAGTVELANPQIEQRVRGESIERYLRVADEHQGTPAAAVAQLEAADLLLEGGDLEAARGHWVEALDSGDASAALRGMLLERVAGVDEREERWLEAARGYEEAGDIASYPPRHLALAAAARCYLNAGEPKRAMELVDRVEREAPDVPLPPHLKARVEEHRIRAEGGAGVPEAASEADSGD
jgi:tetratricopeptide (TPR) repeat protein